MTAQQQTLNLNPSSGEPDEQMHEKSLVNNALYSDGSYGNTGVNRKMKIALIGPAIDRLASHVCWGSRLSSSFYQTVGLNISLRTVTTKTTTADVDIDFVVWQLSPSLSPSLLKRLIQGASALVVAVGQTDETFKFGNEKTESESSYQSSPQSRPESSPQSPSQNTADSDEESSFVWAAGDNTVDIAMLDKSANHLKLPIAFIHFVADSANTLDSQKELEQKKYNNHSSNEGYIVKLHETEHSLHLGLSSEEDSETCLCHAFGYIAEHFVYAT